MVEHSGLCGASVANGNLGKKQMRTRIGFRNKSCLQLGSNLYFFVFPKESVFEGYTPGINTSFKFQALIS